VRRAYDRQAEEPQRTQSTQRKTGRRKSSVRPFVALEPVSDVKDNVAHEVRRNPRIRRPYVASGFIPDVKRNVARIRRPCVALENRDRQLFVLGWLKTSQSLTSNVARTVRPFVAAEPVSDVKDNVAHPSAIGLHRAGKVRHSPFLQFPSSIGEGRLFNIPRFLSGSCHSLLFVDIWMPPYQVRGRLIKSGMTVYVVIPAQAGIQRNSGSTLHITVLLALHRFSSFGLGRWTGSILFVTHYPSRITVFGPFPFNQSTNLLLSCFCAPTLQTLRTQ
jgi:hypothetical protein